MIYDRFIKAVFIVMAGRHRGINPLTTRALMEELAIFLISPRTHINLLELCN